MTPACVAESTFNKVISEPAYKKIQLTVANDKQINDRNLDFVLGKAIFDKFWVASPSSTQSSDGLGPLYNARSCAQCHLNNGRGNLSIADEREVSAVLKLGIISPDKKTVIPHSNYGQQIQTRATVGQKAEAELSFKRQFIKKENDELQIITQALSNLNFGGLDSSVAQSIRIAPALFGMREIEKISDVAIIANEDEFDSDKDGISGRAHWLDDTQNQVGRFGYKAQTASLKEQIQSAFHFDMGLSTPLFPAGSGECTLYQTACITAPNGNSEFADNVEVPDQLVELVKVYLEGIPPAKSKEKLKSDESVEKGATTFTQIGCSTCHIAQLDRNQETSLYTDLLLHDMGVDLADKLAEGRALGYEWRTAPLIGLGSVKRLNPKAGYLHDGRARTIEEAVLWHGGEATNAKQKFVSLNLEYRNQLIQFLNTL